MFKIIVEKSRWSFPGYNYWYISVSTKDWSGNSNAWTKKMVKHEIRELKKQYLLWKKQQGQDYWNTTKQLKPPGTSPQS